MEDVSIPAFLVHIRSELPNLTKAEQRVAQYILDNPNDVLHLSVFSLAECCKTSDATVIRTFRKLGMSTFHEFKILLAQSIVSPLKMVNSDIDSNDPINSTINKVYNGVINTIMLTRDISQDDKLMNAAQLLYNAHQIYVLGMGNSSSVAADFQQKMLRLGLPAIYQPDIHLLRIQIVNFIKPGDVFFAISHSGGSRLVVEAAQMAKKRGASVISLSDVARSPLKDASDICLSTMSEETKYNLYAPSSKIAEYVILDVLYSLISVLHPEESVSHIKEVESSMTTMKY